MKKITLLSLFFVLLAANTIVAQTDETQRPFITTWKTDNPGFSNDNQITIPVNPGDSPHNYNYNVDWGDGTFSTGVRTSITHNYSEPGVYSVSITGDFPRIYFNFNAGDRNKIIEVNQWGDIEWPFMGSGSFAFAGCENLDVVATDVPDLSNVTSLKSMFNGCKSLVGNESFNNWDVSNVIVMEFMFYGASSFNQDIGNWNMASARDVSSMFEFASSFNQNLNGWDVSNVVDMSFMFNGATSFNEELNQWNVGNVQSMKAMFQDAVAFDKDLNNWDVSNVVDMSFMFSEATSFNGNVGEWQVDKVQDMRLMFSYARLFNQYIGEWNVENAVNMSSMFSGASLFNQDIGDWDVSNVTDMRAMFQLAHTFNQYIGNWDVSKVTNMGFMLSGAESFNQDIGDWDVSNVTDMRSMFQAARTFNQDISNWDVGKVTNMSFMLAAAESFNQEIGGWNVSNVIDMSRLFRSTPSFDKDLGNWDVTKVQSMAEMFIDAGLSNENYDKTLIGWNQLPSLQGNVQLDAPQNQYCLSREVRQNIIDAYGWTINDAGEAEVCPQPFVTTWTTTNQGVSDNHTISIPTAPGFDYDYTVDWGDGNFDFNVAGDISHTYENPGTYTVAISGVFGHIRFNSYPGNEANSDATKLIEINQWGDIQWQSMLASFAGCSNLEVVATDVPDLTNVNSLFGTFSYCSSMTGENSLRNWDVSTITDLTQTFYVCSNFNEDLSGWDVSNVTNMVNLFVTCASFNQDISSWDVSNVKNMLGMFYGATAFNQPIGNWNVGQVENMSNMFSYANSFDQDLNDWDISSVVDLSFMFSFNSVFNQDISNWNVANVQNMDALFQASVFNQDISSWNISMTNSMKYMFNNSSFSDENYDKILMGWSQLPTLQNGVQLDALQNQYCEAADARQGIIDAYGWVINDGGADTELPIAICQDITVQLNGEGFATITAADIDNGSNDNCGIEGLSISSSNFTSENIGENTVTLTVTDANGNTASCDAQVMVVAPLWLEDFNELSNGTAVDNGSTAWSAIRDGGVFEVFDGRFRVNGSGSGPGTWTSEIIPISGTVSVSLDVDDSDQKKERADYLRALYILDGGTPVEFGFVSDDIEPQTFTVDNLTGSTLQIVVESEVSGSPENYYIDNVVVLGEPTSGSSYTLTVNSGSGDGTYEAGEVVNIVADAAPSGQQFEAWTGDIGAVSDINSATTTLTMPSANAEITATYSTIPSGGTIWLEDFEDLVNGATVDNGSTAWNSTRDNGVFEVLNGRFRTNGSSSGPGTWTSEVISISGAVSISMDVDDSDQKKERADYLRAYYVLDGGTPVMFGSVSDDIDPQTITAENLSGSTIQIIVESKVSGSPENYYIDNIAVSGFSTNLTARIGDNAESNTPKSRSPFEIKLYPNPATTQVTTTFDEAVELIDIKVFDMTGRLVKVHKVADQKMKVNYSMNVNELPSGTYFIIMEDAKGKQFRKQMVIGN
ncbi:BspA family leucine-rich repeat surface protein [Flagellimonas sp.]|uniref:BspA family leucine-rich repeat surface protein n=1 Tax=Flagellimonas sp. TaxID=2058762 RepID=UPI003B5171B8